MSIAQRLTEIEETIRTCAGDRPVTLVAVTKYAEISQMREAYASGVRHFGENKVQDALSKMEAFPASDYPDLHWHFIGHLQTNKIRKAVGRFSLIHSIESVKQAEMLSHLSAEAGMRQAVLIQVNSAPDESRNGVLPGEAEALARAIMPLPGLQLRGLMTMAPAEASLNNDGPELARVFGSVAELGKDLARHLAIDPPELSMGMTHDFPHALKCGATIIRIGNYLFKNR